MKKLFLATIFTSFISTTTYSQQANSMFDFSYPVKCGPTIAMFSILENMFTKAKILGLNEDQDVTTTIHIHEENGMFAITQSNLQNVTCVIAIGNNNGLFNKKDFEEM